MIAPDIREQLADFYGGIEGSLPVRVDPTLVDLVVPVGNDRQPFHRWFHVKEAFSYMILPQLVKDLGLSSKARLSILDPFCGGGTIPLSALELRSGSIQEVEALGVEVNPFLHRLASVKCRAAFTTSSNVRESLGDIADRGRRRSRRGLKPPSLSTFSRGEYFPTSQLESLLALALETSELPRGTRRQRLIQDLGFVALGSIVEACSRLRRDGRTMRFYPDRILDDPFALFEKAVDVMATDIEANSTHPERITRLRIARGDGRRIAQYKNLAKLESVDLVLFSPPYPNNIDYTEVYKLEAWITGAYRSSEEFRSQRLRTLRSHPSVMFRDRYRFLESTGLGDRLSPVLDAIPTGRYRLQRERLVRGYVDDMVETFVGLKQVARPAGRIVYVVANSLHGRDESSWLLASDLLLAEAARAAGLVVEDFRIARQLHRRGSENRLLRESVVTLRRPLLKASAG